MKAKTPYQIYIERNNILNKIILTISFVILASVVFSACSATNKRNNEGWLYKAVKINEDLRK